MKQSTKNNDCWFTPETMVMIDKIIKERWFVREVIYPKEVSGCEIFNYNGCKRLYHDKDRFFALEGEALNYQEGKYCNLNADFFSGEKIVIQQRDDAAFDHWQSQPFELTSLWPGRQLVVVANHKTMELIAFSPVFMVCTPEFHVTRDMEKSFMYEKEFLTHWKHIEKDLGKAISPEMLSFLRNSHNLQLWLKNHCY